VADDEYATVRHENVLVPFIGQTLVDVTQQDAEEFAETGQSYVALHFSNGGTVTFPIGDACFHIETNT
jgi:hypothetical protein